MLLTGYAWTAQPALAGGAARPAVPARGGADAGGLVYHSSNGRRATNPLLLEADRARAELNRVANRLRRQFRESPELLSARVALREAALAFNSARNSALADLRSTPEYRDAQERIVQLQRRVDTERSGASGNALVAAASALMEARAAVSKLENATLSSSEDFAAVRDAYRDANGRLVGLVRDFNDSIRHDPDFVAAKERLDAIRDQLARRR